MSQSAVLVVEDDHDLREALCDTLEVAGYRALGAADGTTALEAIGSESVVMVVSDVQMRPMDGHRLLKKIRARRPELPVVLMTAYGTIEKAVAAMRDGATDYLVKPFEADRLVELVGRYLPAAHSADLVAEDPATRRMLELASRVAASEATVMIAGESGTGKEVFARHIHQHSARAAGPFVAINCAAIPESMLEAVLFGHEKGAFTGAYQAHPGKFEQAQGGTLLLDEVSEMDLSLQAKLLRVLQEREVERLGGRRPVALDVRVLATTNRNLRAEVVAGRFREDLFYRLNVFPLNLPPLRERPGDILPLARRVTEYYGRDRRVPPRLSEGAEQRLLRHAWPGNVRELENLVQRALILASGEVIGIEHLYFGLGEEPVFDPAPMGAPEPRARAGGGGEGGTSSLEEDLRVREQRLILEALCEGHGSRKRAAEKLGISPRTLRYKLARLRESGVEIPTLFGAEPA
ncbi:MAG TPA: sigma-54-dependent Fis family transcriptional regulator [Chromatiales bacterium]|nr:sigma-54-dependent Fis family transcriptional regulator [Chromatiales bacterium]